MREPRARRAVSAALAVAVSFDLDADADADDAVVLHESNRITLWLTPGDVLARVAPLGEDAAGFEVELARRLTLAGAPVASPHPRVPAIVHEHDGFAITLWTHHPPVPPLDVPASDYAHALARLHEGLREIDLPAPRFTDRVAQARALVDDHHRTPELTAPDRELLAGTLREMERSVLEHGAPERLLHGEPHPGNLLPTAEGPLFVDLETCCRGPVEFDLAHAPDEVADHYPDVDRELLRRCRTLMTAMIAAWRWDRDDRFPDGRRQGIEWIARLRAATGADGAGLR
ncbi:aminoglycoside phosphotransferase family protein [Nocardiopsis alba]|uniref:phosphotransferase n=1 Tax=Nocardiopsis alba TaxID=53437 RepID=UPI0005A622CB|nr:aminoglycoside phosphotransferase family protein [Nocardiopsis alba]